MLIGPHANKEEIALFKQKLLISPINILHNQRLNCPEPLPSRMGDFILAMLIYVFML